jgi:hypothetical protein
MKQTLKYCLLLCLFFEMVSCGAYKLSTTETTLKEQLVESQKQINDKVILEILESTLAYYGDSIKGFEPQKAQPKKAQPKWTLNTKKTTKTVDKGTLEKKTESNTDSKVEATEKQNPWRPPWYVSGLIVLVLLVVWQVFKTNFRIIKRT